MAENGFPKRVEDIVATLVDIYRYQGLPDFVKLLESAKALIEQRDSDHWNGGTNYYALMLEVPVPVFVTIGSNLLNIENDITSKLNSICRNLTHDYINSVSITPVTSKTMNVSSKTKPADAELNHIWKENFFRLFLSHIAEHKVAVSKLKSELQLRGISAFVAHEDIAPSKEWQNEIMLALGSMHALAALLTVDFHPSEWTDQEIGFALGKDVPIVPVCLGTQPYGFIGKFQALRGSLDQPAQVASLLLTTLLNHPLTHRHMCRGLVFAFEVANSYANAKDLGKFISTVKDFSDDEKEIILRACKENSQVFNAIGVVSRVCSAIGVSEPSKITAIDDLPF